MGATLDALHRLQAVESQLRSVRERVNSKKRQLEARRRRLASLEQQVAETQDQTRKAQTEADRLELDRSSHEAHISKLREVLNQAKTNKEYAAVLTQLNTDKADAMRLEDRVLAGLTKVDELKQRIAQLKADKEKEQAHVAELDKSVGQLEAELSDRLRKLETQRTTLATEVPPQALNMFERACSRHGGEAMAIIEKVHPKRADYVCGGCNMSVTLETINALQSRDDIRQCSTCSRILYLDAPAEVTA